MAFGQTALGANETAWLAADKPVIVGSHLYRPPTQLLWADANDWVDESHASFPAVYGIDGANTLKTMPDSSLGAGNSWRYKAEIVVPLDVDAIAILGLDNAPGGGYTLYTRFAGTGDSAFASDLGETLSASPPSGENHLFLLGFRYTDVKFISLEWQVTSGSVQPSFREILFGRRRQLSTKMDRPYDADNMPTESSMGETEAKVGAASRYTRFTNRAIPSGDFVVNSTDLASLKAWHETDTQGGIKAFAYCENPNSGVNDFRLLLSNTQRFDPPRETHFKWRVPFRCREQGANFRGAV
jgi:hypothetical protein